MFVSHALGGKNHKVHVTYIPIRVVPRNASTFRTRVYKLIHRMIKWNSIRDHLIPTTKHTNSLALSSHEQQTEPLHIKIDTGNNLAAI
jgi:hypothetical protein